MQQPVGRHQNPSADIACPPGTRPEQLQAILARLGERIARSTERLRRSEDHLRRTDARLGRTDEALRLSYTTFDRTASGSTCTGGDTTHAEAAEPAQSPPS